MLLSKINRYCILLNRTFSYTSRGRQYSKRYYFIIFKYNIFILAPIVGFGDVKEVEDKYHLPNTTKKTARIVKVLHESGKALNTHELWDEIWVLNN